VSGRFFVFCFLFCFYRGGHVGAPWDGMRGARGEGSARFFLGVFGEARFGEFLRAGAGVPRSLSRVVFVFCVGGASALVTTPWLGFNLHRDAVCFCLGGGHALILDAQRFGERGLGTFLHEAAGRRFSRCEGVRDVEDCPRSFSPFPFTISDARRG
jgi:hypothetical protein